MLDGARCVRQFPASLPENWVDVELLYSLQPEYEKTPFNFPAWLRVCAEIRGGSLFKVFEHEDLIGAFGLRPAKFRVGDRRFEGLVPLPFPCADFVCPIVKHEKRELFWDTLIEFLRSKMSYAPVLFEHVRGEDKQIISLLCGPAVVVTPNPVREHKVLPFEDVLKKKSLRRHKNALLRAGTLSVSHEFAAKRDQLKVLATLHAERWSFEGQPSVLTDPETFLVYERMFADRNGNEYSPSMILTTLKWNDEPIAMHLGYIWNNTFLYHLPAINIKYIDEWPGEVLMYELFCFALSRRVEVFDFGVGDESYKSRYASTVEEYNTFLLTEPRSLGLMSQMARAALKVRCLLSPRAVVRRLIGRKKAEVRNVVRFYCRSGSKEDREYTLKEFGFKEYVDYARTQSHRPYALSRGTYERFQQGWRLFALCIANRPVSFGWVFEGDSMYLAELGKSAHVASGALWLLDFYTFEAERGNGYYPALLNAISGEFAGACPIIIYALEFNSASNRGIEKAGFTWFASGDPCEGISFVNEACERPALSLC